MFCLQSRWEIILMHTTSVLHVVVGCEKGSEKGIAEHVYISSEASGFVYLSCTVDMFVCLQHLYHLVSLCFSRFNIEMLERLGTHTTGYFLMMACETEILR